MAWPAPAVHPQPELPAGDLFFGGFASPPAIFKPD